MAALRVLVAGGGVAALEAVLALRSLAGDRVRVELLAPTAGFAQRPYSVRSPFSGEPVPEGWFDRRERDPPRGRAGRGRPGAPRGRHHRRRHARRATTA